MIQPTKKGNNKKPTTRSKRKTKPNYGTSKLETYFANTFLDKLGLNYVYEYMAEDIKRFYDFAIVATQPNTELVLEEKNGVKSISQSKNLIRPLFLIEIDGEHWHPDLDKVKWDELSPMQKHNAMVDKLKNEWCVKHRLPLLRIWEYDIRNNPQYVFEKIKEFLDKLEHRDKIKAGLNRPHKRRT